MNKRKRQSLSKEGDSDVTSDSRRHGTKRLKPDVSGGKRSGLYPKVQQL